MGSLLGAVNCQEITGVDLRGLNGRLRYIREDKGRVRGRFESELCRQIVQRPFQDIEEYAAFIEQGGCREVIAFVADWVEDRS